MPQYDPIDRVIKMEDGTTKQVIPPLSLIWQLIRHIDPNPNREGLKDTPLRVVNSWRELFCGYAQNPETVLQRGVFANHGYDELVLVCNIDFFSTCEHHMLPFVGTAAIGYIPDKFIAGLSKLPRLLEIYSRRLTIQERITTEVTIALENILKPKGAACILKATHSCMGCRGVRQPSAETITSSLTGVFREDPKARSELFQLIGG